MSILATDDQLTPKQRAFVDHYLISGNGVESARKAGYKGEYNSLASIANENLRKLEIRKALGQRTKQSMVKAEKQIVNVYEEFQKNLQFVGKLRDACEKWLNVTGEFAIEPRTDEIDVIYWDYNQDPPVAVKERLDRVLAGSEGREMPKVTPFVKCVDLREYALKVIDRIDTTLDKFAKMGGEYTKDKENPQALSEAVTAYINCLKQARELHEVAPERYDEPDAKEIAEYVAKSFNLPVGKVMDGGEAVN